MYQTYHYDVLPSTNLKALELGQEGADHGTAVVAGDQSGGRGRLGKNWHSVSGKGLYCSIIVRPDLATTDYPKITLAAGLATAKVVSKVTGKTPQLKWPNDIYLTGKKCAGILTESANLGGIPEDRFAVVGIGMNISHQLNDFPPDLEGNVTSLVLEAPRDYVIEDIFTAIRESLIETLDEFIENGFASILSQWCTYDFLFGKKMQCVSSEGLIIEGVALGPNEDGELRVRDASNRLHTVLTADIRLGRHKSA